MMRNKHSKSQLVRRVKSRSREQSGTVSLQQFFCQRNVSVTRTHDTSFDIICWIEFLTIFFKNRLVSSEGS
jgi:hypothetical protein